MDDEIETLMVEVRASTSGFRADVGIDALRARFLAARRLCAGGRGA